MGYCDYEENFYEPHELEIVLEEYKKKCKEIMLAEITTEIKNLKQENAEMKAAVDEFKKREHELAAKERNLSWKEDNLKTELEKEFYDSNIGEALKRFVEDCEVWYAEDIPHKREKCSLCNDKRELILQFPNGKTAQTNCDCAVQDFKYEPRISVNRTIRFEKTNSDYRSERKFFWVKDYIPLKNSHSDFPYTEFSIRQIFDDFEVLEDNVTEAHEHKRYGEELAFRSKRACQLYCDWLNENNE